MKTEAKLAIAIAPGTIRTNPAAIQKRAAKIGFLTISKRPPVTSSVGSPALDPDPPRVAHRQRCPEPDADPGDHQDQTDALQGGLLQRRERPIDPRAGPCRGEARGRGPPRKAEPAGTSLGNAGEPPAMLRPVEPVWCVVDRDPDPDAEDSR